MRDGTKYMAAKLGAGEKETDRRQDFITAIGRVRVEDEKASLSRKTREPTTELERELRRLGARPDDAEPLCGRAEADGTRQSVRGSIDDMSEIRFPSQHYSPSLGPASFYSPVAEVDDARPSLASQPARVASSGWRAAFGRAFSLTRDRRLDTLADRYDGDGDSAHSPILSPPRAVPRPSPSVGGRPSLAFVPDGDAPLRQQLRRVTPTQVVMPKPLSPSRFRKFQSQPPQRILSASHQLYDSPSPILYASPTSTAASAPRRSVQADFMQRPVVPSLAPHESASSFRIQMY